MEKLNVTFNLFRTIDGKTDNDILVGGIKNRLKISVFYGEKVVHLADI